MATAFENLTVTTTETDLFESADGRCLRFLLGCRADSANSVLVNIPGLHAANEWFAIPPGSFVEYESRSACQVNGITRVRAKGSGGDARVDGGVTAKVT